MSTTFSPHFSGVYKPEAIAGSFVENLAARVRKGLFPMASAQRNQYEIVGQAKDSLHFRSARLLTGITIGLNDVQIQVDRASGEIRYEVFYWTWAKYCIYLCLGIGGICGFCLMTPLFGLYLFSKESYPSLAVIKFGVLPMTIFWGLIWPWILIPFHKGPASKCLTKILGEVNTDGI